MVWKLTNIIHDFPEKKNFLIALKEFAKKYVIKFEDSFDNSL